MAAGFGADLRYFQKRAEEEVKRAQRATSPAAVAAHYALSELYLERVAELQEQVSRSGDDAD